MVLGIGLWGPQGRVVWPSTADGGMWRGACGQQHGCQHGWPRLDACHPSLFLVLVVNEHDSKGECPCHSGGLVSREPMKERVYWLLAVINLSGFPPRQGPGHG